MEIVLKEPQEISGQFYGPGTHIHVSDDMAKKLLEQNKATLPEVKPPEEKPEPGSQDKFKTIRKPTRSHKRKQD